VEPDLEFQIKEYIENIPYEGEEKVQILDMSESPSLGTGCRVVAGSLPKCKKLREIHLSQCDIQDAGAKVLFNALIKHQDLHVVNFDNNLLTDACLDQLYILLQ